MMLAKKITVIGFVDWNSQIWSATIDDESPPSAPDVLEHVVRKVERSLQKFPRDMNFEVHLRAYYGWHKGFQPTPQRKELARLSEDDLYSLGKLSNVWIRTLRFGDLSLGALRERVSKGTGSHYPATCRERGFKGHEEKMVDTALVSDLVFAASVQDDTWLVVLGEDIDLMPGVYTAEGLIAGTKRKVAYLGSQSEKYLSCEGLDSFALSGN